MITDINSIILEGTIDDTTPFISAYPGKPTIGVFHITTTKQKRYHNNISVEKFHFAIRVTGDLLDKCMQRMGSGERVRVVGSLEQDWRTSVNYIVATFVEFLS